MLSSNPSRLPLFLSILLLFSLAAISATSNLPPAPDGVKTVAEWKTTTMKTRRSAEEEAESRVILAEENTRRKDPLHHFKLYHGGWNISDRHYWASVGFTAAPFFVIAVIWFVVFGLILTRICCCYPRPREPYGYSRGLLAFFAVAAIVGCVVLYTGQWKLHNGMTAALGYVVCQSDVTAESLNNVSGYLAAAQLVGVRSPFLPTVTQTYIVRVQMKIKFAAASLSTKTRDNSRKIRDGLDSVRLPLIILAAVMLFLTFLGFSVSFFGSQGLVYALMIGGWILVAGIFILCGVFLAFHNVVADTCVAMDEWADNPTEHTALDDILPCVDKKTAQETLLRTWDVVHQLVSVVDTVLSTITNRNFPPDGRSPYYNQSGPVMPFLCNPYNANHTARQCEAGEVDFRNASEVWRSYICEVSAAGICATTGRLTPSMYGQFDAAVNSSFGLYRYVPFLVELQDCAFARETFAYLGRNYCPGLRRHSQWIYIGLVMVSAAVMLSLIFWVVYARERPHDTRLDDARADPNPEPQLTKAAYLITCR